MLKFTLTVAVLGMTAMLVLSNSGALAQDSGDEPGMGGLIQVDEVPQDVPRDTTGGGTGGDSSGPLTPGTPGHQHRGDDTTSQTEGPQDPGGNGGNGGGNNNGGFVPDTTQAPIYTASCYYGNAPLGAYLTNTGNRVLPAGTIVVFHLPGGDVEMELMYDVVPGGQFAFFIKYPLDDDHPWLEFPVGTQLPINSVCDAGMLVA